MIKFNGLPSVVPVERDFCRLMNICKSNFNSIWDKLLTMATGYIEIDIIKLDVILHERFGEYEDAGKSMEDIIRENYGEEAVDLINRLIK